MALTLSLFLSVCPYMSIHRSACKIYICLLVFLQWKCQSLYIGLTDLPKHQYVCKSVRLCFGVSIRLSFCLYHESYSEVLSGLVPMSVSISVSLPLIDFPGAKIGFPASSMSLTCKMTKSQISSFLLARIALCCCRCCCCGCWCCCCCCCCCGLLAVTERESNPKEALIFSTK